MPLRTRLDPSKKPPKIRPLIIYLVVALCLLIIALTVTLILSIKKASSPETNNSESTTSSESTEPTETKTETETETETEESSESTKSHKNTYFADFMNIRSKYELFFLQMAVGPYLQQKTKVKIKPHEKKTSKQDVDVPAYHEYILKDKKTLTFKDFEVYFNSFAKYKTLLEIRKTKDTHNIVLNFSEWFFHTAYYIYRYITDIDNVFSPFIIGEFEARELEGVIKPKIFKYQNYVKFHLFRNVFYKIFMPVFTNFDLLYADLLLTLNKENQFTKVENKYNLEWLLRYPNIITYNSLISYLIFIKENLLDIEIEENEKMTAFIENEEMWNKIKEIVGLTEKLYVSFEKLEGASEAVSKFYMEKIGEIEDKLGILANEYFVENVN
eukprot:GAHX01001224.1.p1 GENE.GAHX01001224.1~~GAHX01001224.1.p1  ORF type:complete len:384 (-),score=61.36 GAHX01001224.1:29-1180(-)